MFSIFTGQTNRNQDFGSQNIEINTNAENASNEIEHLYLLSKR